MIIDPYRWQRHQIETITRIATDTVAVGFRRPPGYQFRAGQYAVVRITTTDGSSYIRQYSFSSAPSGRSLELLIQREPEGIVSTWFCDKAEPGSEIELSQPLGNFTLDNTANRPILLIAGRIGIAPFISMLRDTTRRNVSVLYSVRNDEQICFPQLLERFRATIIRTEVSPRIGKAFLAKMVADRPLIYVCGSKQFVDSMAEALHALGVPTDDVKRELFTLQ